jgi:HlyD family secretion protein
MAQKKKKWLRAMRWAIGLLVLSGVLGAVLAACRALAHPPAYLALARVPAGRVELHATLAIGGDVDSAQKTIVECKLERRASTIIELVSDGTMVEKGQVLARLDSSEEEEKVRQYEILYNQAQADERKARYDLDVAEIGLKEYREGQLDQLRETYQGQIVLNRSDISRQKERIAWAERMSKNGYISEGNLLQERATLQKSEVSLATVEGALATLDKYTAPLQIKRLQSAIEQARLELDYQVQRLRNLGDLLQSFRDQVQACTIRAPHPGRIIYANTFNPRLRIEPGAYVFNHMILFYLPDLSQLEVQAEVHESMIQRVRPGQPAKVRVGGLPRQTLDGHVKSVEPLPREARNWKTSREVRNFQATIAIHSAPPGVLPGMSAEVEIAGEIRPNALVVPSTAVATEGGQDVVYMPGPTSLERRVVEVVPGDSQYVEVRSGLAAGEEVILDPTTIDPVDTLAARTSSDSNPTSSGL